MKQRLFLPLFALALVAAALVWPTTRQPGEADTPDRKRPSERAAHRSAGHSAGSVQEAAPASVPPRASAVTARPANAAGSDSAARRRPPFVAELFVASGKGAIDAYREGWELIEPLLYPNDHPCAGLPRDSVSPDQLTDAGMQAVALRFPPDVLDKPQLHWVGRQDFLWINQKRRQIDETDLDSARAFYDDLVASPPRGREMELWLPAEPNDPEATSYRELFGSQVRNEVDRIFALGPCRS